MSLGCDIVGSIAFLIVLISIFCPDVFHNSIHNIELVYGDFGDGDVLGFLPCVSLFSSWSWVKQPRFGGGWVWRHAESKLFSELPGRYPVSLTPIVLIGSFSQILLKMTTSLIPSQIELRSSARFIMRMCLLIISGARAMGPILN
jgi:hypothetical protein